MPRSDDQHVVRRQWRERATQLHVMSRAALGLYRDLHGRNISGGEHVAQRYPRTVIETPTTIDPRGDSRALEQADDFFGERRRAPGWILNLVKLRREAAEIVDRLRLRIAGDHRYGGFPMRRRDHDRARLQRLSKRSPHTSRLAGRDRMHRRAV